MPRFKKLIPAPLLLSLVVVVLVGCEQKIEPGTPLLPPGFDDGYLPDVDLDGYVYVNQQKSLRLSMEWFYGEAIASPSALGTQATSEADVERVTVMMGPSVDNFGVVVEFSLEEGANTASRLLQENADVWSSQRDKSLSLVRGEGVWPQSLKEAMDGNRRVALGDRYPKVWELLSILPENPPTPPIAAGFLRIEKSILEAIGTKGNIGLGNASQVIGLMKARNIAFAVYAENPVHIPEKVDETFFEELRIGAVFVSQSGYPGFIVSTALNFLGGRAGLAKTTIGDTSVRYMTIQDIHLFVKNQESIIYAALAPDKAQAEALMLSALGR